MTTTASAAVSSREVDLGEDTGDRLVGICIAFIILTTLFIALRFFSRHFTVATFGLDDVFMLAAYFVDLGLCAIGIGESPTVRDLTFEIFIIFSLSTYQTRAWHY